MINVVKLQCDDQGPSLLCMNEVLGQLGEIGEIEQEGSNVKVYLLVIIFDQIFYQIFYHIFYQNFYRIFYQDWLMAANKGLSHSFDLLQVQCLAACEDQINQISISQSRMPNR